MTVIFQQNDRCMTKMPVDAKNDPHQSSRYLIIGPVDNNRYIKQTVGKVMDRRTGDG